MHSSWLIVQPQISWMWWILMCNLWFYYLHSQCCVRLWLRLSLSYVLYWLRPQCFLLFFSWWSLLNRMILALRVLLWILFSFSLLIFLWIFDFTLYYSNLWAWFIFCKFSDWDITLVICLFGLFICICIEIWSWFINYVWGFSWLLTEIGRNMATSNSH